MLTASKIIAFIATAKPTQSRNFYEELLGLKVRSDDEFATVFDANGVELRVQKVDAFIPQQHTQLGWSVDRIDEVVEALQAKGITFERFFSLKQDAHDIWSAPSGARVAWLKDPDGNLLSLTECASI